MCLDENMTGISVCKNTQGAGGPELRVWEDELQLRPSFIPEKEKKVYARTMNSFC